MQRNIQRDFKSLIEKKIYIDRTMFVKKVLREQNSSQAYLYPSGTGKSVNLSMLRYFFSSHVDGEETKALFNNLEISRDAECMQRQGQYSVIYLDLNDVAANNSEDILNYLQKKHTPYIKSMNFLLRVHVLIKMREKTVKKFCQRVSKIYPI